MTLAIFAYRQEAFIREAAESAFAQTYSPLEIILSDDHSPDRTFEIMQEMAAAYQGPHSVILNRNEVNLGLGGHLEKVVSLVRSQWLVVGAGDDLSLPCRVEKTAERFLADPTTVCVFSNVAKMAADGKPLGALYFKDDHRFTLDLESAITANDCWVLGASAAYSMELFRRFPPLRRDLAHEDNILAFRAALIGKTEYLPEPLVSYRIFDDGRFLLSGETKLRFTSRPNAPYHNYMILSHWLFDYLHLHGQEDPTARKLGRLREIARRECDLLVFRNLAFLQSLWRLFWLGGMAGQDRRAPWHLRVIRFLRLPFPRRVWRLLRLRKKLEPGDALWPPENAGDQLAGRTSR